MMDEQKSGQQPKTGDADPLLGLMGIMKGSVREGADAFLRELRRDKEAVVFPDAK